MGGREIAEWLGGRKALGKTIVSSYDLADVIEKGLYPSALDRVKAFLGLTDREVSSALDISEKTVWRLRRQRSHRLPVSTSDRLYRIARLSALAEQVLEDRERAREWLRSPQIGLNERVPLELMRTEAGAREIEDLLIRIEHGVLS